MGGLLEIEPRRFADLIRPQTRDMVELGPAVMGDSPSSAMQTHLGGTLPNKYAHSGHWPIVPNIKTIFCVFSRACVGLSFAMALSGDLDYVRLHLL